MHVLTHLKQHIRSGISVVVSTCQYAALIFFMPLGHYALWILFYYYYYYNYYYGETHIASMTLLASTKVQCSFSEMTLLKNL